MAWTLAQQSAIQTTTASGALTATITASTAGNLLILKVVTLGSTTAPTAVTTGFVSRVTVSEATTPIGRADVYEYLNNPGGITSVTATVTTGGALIVEEHTCPGVASAVSDKTGTASNASPVTPFNIATSATVTANNELAVTAYGLRFSTSTSTSLTAGTGFTQSGAFNNAVKAINHAAFDYQLDTGSSAGATVTDAVTVSVTGAGTEFGVIATYPQPVVAGGLTAPLLPVRRSRAPGTPAQPGSAFIR